MKFNIAFIGLMVLFSIVLPANADAQALQTLTSSDIPAIIAEMNQDRQAQGLSPLRINPALSAAAQSRSQLLAGEGRIYHVSAPAGTPWPNLARAGYSYTNAGENLAVGIEATGTLEDRWMNSPSHRENIVNGIYEDVGVGVTSGYYANTPASYVVVYFGKKAPAGTTPTAAPQTQAVAQAKGKTAQPSLTTQSTIASSEAPKSLSSARAPSPDGEKVRLLTQLINLLGSYLEIVRGNAGLI
jgi:hypothetical protein